MEIEHGDEEAEEEKDSRAPQLENRNSRVDTPLQIVRVMTPRFKSHASSLARFPGRGGRKERKH